MRRRGISLAPEMKRAILGGLAALCWLAANARADDYSDGIAAAKAARTTEWSPAVFSSLTVIDDALLHTITVDDGLGGTKTIEAVRVTTLTNFLTPYEGATFLQPFVVDTVGNFRSNMWVTVAGELRDYYFAHGLPVTDNATVTGYMQQALGLGLWGPYEALTFYVEPEYVTRPSFAPSVFENIAPTWTGSSYAFTNVEEGVDDSFIGFAPTVLDFSGTSYLRPYTEFDGKDNYEGWLAAWSEASYNTDANRAFPYTGLGWTWNWNTDPNLNGFALSEFIISGGATYYFVNLVDPIDLVPEPGTCWLIAAAGGWLLLRRKPLT